MLLDYIPISVTNDNRNKQQFKRRATYSINKCDSNNNKYGQQQLDNTPVGDNKSNTKWVLSWVLLPIYNNGSDKYDCDKPQKTYNKY